MDTGQWTTIPDLIDDAADRFGDLEALVDGDIRWTFTELQASIHQAARATMASGIADGDRVAVWAPNVWEWVVAALGVHTAGGVVVPINTRWKGREAAYAIENSGARMLFTIGDFLGTDYYVMLSESGRPNCLEETVLFRADDAATGSPGVVSFDDFLARADQTSAAERADRSGSVTGESLCHIMFTSGTTGSPKGAMLTHGAVCRAYWSWASVVGLDRDRYLIINPFFHSFGLNAGILACLMTGSTIVPHPVFDVPSVMARIPEERISMLPGPPAIYQTILNSPDLSSFDMSTLRLAVTGAAPVPVPMIEAMREQLGFDTIITGYGLTESSGMATMCRHDDDPEVISRTSGRAIDGVEVAVVDEDGNEMPRGDPGEIVVRGYNVMPGYFNDPVRTADAVDPDGWLHTGDIGIMDAEGYIVVTDRLKDMFITGGFNAYPAEIEAAMLTHPGVGQVAVVGAPDERLGEVGHAFVVRSPGDTTTVADLLSWCREHMANYKAPRHVVFVESLPLNASGKVLKYELREQLGGTDR